MKKEPPIQINHEIITLSEEEATELAAELKEQLTNGQTPNINEQYIQRLVAGLGDPRGLLRRTFAQGLGEAGTASLPALQSALLKSPNVTIRRAAAKALRLVGDPRALPDLLEALINDPDPVVQGSAVGAMAIFGEKAVMLLQTVLANPKSTAMQCGLASWGIEFVGAEAPEALKSAAQSQHPKVRSAAIAALGDQIHSLRDLDARNILIGALSDPSSEVRTAATTLLGKLNDPIWAAPLLEKKLNDSSNQVRKHAALSLMQLQSFSSINCLIGRENIETDPEVTRVIKLAIRKLSEGI